MSSIEVSCTCRPSPPGGTTRCEGGQIAVCGDGGTGICEGRCVGVDPNLTSMEYTAQLISAVIRTNLSTQDLEDNTGDFAEIVNMILQSSDQNKTVRFQFYGRSYHVSVGLTEVAKQKLAEAAESLVISRPQPRVAR